jgi:hypothetical protein
MTEPEFRSTESMLARYRPIEPPPDLLSRVEQIAVRRRRVWPEPLTVFVSAVAEIALGLVIRGLIAATGPAALLLISAKGH